MQSAGNEELKKTTKDSVKGLEDRETVNLITHNILMPWARPLDFWDYFVPLRV